MLLIFQDVAQRYVTCGETASAVALLEAAIRANEVQLGLRSSAVTSGSRMAERLFDTLNGEDAHGLQWPGGSGVTLCSACTTLLRSRLPLRNCLESLVLRNGTEGA
eukprot:jgi/Botrbrau1/2477/Bobra.0226s0035.1